jgi:tetraacyldisaccharide 4'-kinase
MTLPPLLRLLLWPFSVLYGVATQLRVWLYARGIFKQKRLSKPVISVGNLTVGGTGKTPMVIWLAKRLLAEGKRVGILSRGYKGAGGTSDEIEVMKAHLKGEVQFGLGADRFARGKRLEGSVDVFVLDDGFQHLQLARDVNILLIDSSRPLARQKMLPTGTLREPVSGMTRADLLVFTRAETVSGSEAALGKYEGHPVFSTATRLLGFRRLGSANELTPPAEIGAGPFYAFCGIGNPRAFLQDLKNWKLALVGQSEFADHHRYDARDAAELEVAAKQSGAKMLITTEKDAQNLAGVDFQELPVHIAVIDLVVSREAELMKLIHDGLERRKAA